MIIEAWHVEAIPESSGISLVVNCTKILSQTQYCLSITMCCAKQVITLTFQAILPFISLLELGVTEKRLSKQYTTQKKISLTTSTVRWTDAEGPIPPDMGLRYRCTEAEFLIFSALKVSSLPTLISPCR